MPQPAAKPRAAPKSLTPAALVVDRFERQGLHVGDVADVCGVNVTTVYYWLRPKREANAPRAGGARSRGAGGIIPAKHHPALLEGAAARGIRLTPREVVYGR